MRIVVITTSFPRNDDDPSGHFVRASAVALARDGHEVHVIAPGGSLLDAPIRNGPITIHPSSGGSLFTWPGALARIREAPLRFFAAFPFAIGVRSRLMQLGPIDRAVAHWIVPSAFPLLAATDVPLEIFAHGADVRVLSAMPGWAREFVLSTLLARQARFIFAARASLTALAASTSPAISTALLAASHVEPPPIDMFDVTSDSLDMRSSLALEPEGRVAVVACRLIPDKRVDLALEAVSCVNRPLHLVVLGDGPARAMLEQRASALGIAVHFKGALPRRKALAWIGAADLLLHTSMTEAAPTAIREARSLGVPVVACDAGDIAAWAAADRGIIVVAPTPQAIAEGIARC